MHAIGCFWGNISDITSLKTAFLENEQKRAAEIFQDAKLNPRE